MENIKKTINGIKGIGLGNAFRAIIYTWKKKRADKNYWEMVNAQKGELFIPGKISRTEEIESGVRINFQHDIELEIKFLKSNLVRTTWTPGKLPLPYALTEKEWKAIPVEVEQKDDDWIVSSGDLNVHIYPCGSISYIENSNLIRHENPPRLEGNDWTQTADLEDDAKVFGMGEQANKLDLRGNSFDLWNTDPGGSYKFKEGPLYMPLPVYFIKNEGSSYFAFHENTFKGKLEFEENISINFMGGALRTYITTGSIREVTGTFADLTGKPTLPPLWSLGFHQSRWGYKSEGDIRRIAKGYLENDLPIRSIHMDIDYMDGFRVFTVDKEKYPDLKNLSEDMDKQGIKLVTILDPAVKIDNNYSFYNEGIENRLFAKDQNGKAFRGLVWPGWSSFPDFTNPRTREWWKEKYSVLLDQGVSGIWHDMNEPASFVSDGDSTLPLLTQHDLEGERGDHSEAHNVYGLNMNRAGYEAQLQHRPERRPWLLTRSGWVGTQRYAWHWTGDIESSWDALKMTVAGLLNLGISGIPYSGSDIGGFSGKADTELFIRWFQLAAFTPFFRNHAACHTPDSEPWEYGQEAVDIIRDILQVRETLLPYIYTCSWQATKHGYPLMRPMFWDDPEDEVFRIEDSYYFGDHLLVAPILGEAENKRDVYFPKGTWIDFCDGKDYKGNMTHRVEVAINKIPVFVRSGAVIPLTDSGNRILRLYIGKSADQSTTSEIFSDAGDGFGASRLETLKVEKIGENIIIERVSEGEFDLQLDSELQLIGGKTDKISVDGKAITPDGKIMIKSEFEKIKIKLR